MGGDLGPDGIEPGGPHAPTPHPPSRAGRTVEDSRRIVHKTCEHADPFATCMEGSCPALRSRTPGWDFVLTDDGWRWVRA